VNSAAQLKAAAIEAEGHDSHFTPHIASPDVVVDHENRTLWMAFHGLCEDGRQLTRRVHGLRDPGILEDDGRVWLLYTVAGESGIAIAELHGSPIETGTTS
jgi:hypothetical protein